MYLQYVVICLALFPGDTYKDKVGVEDGPLTTFGQNFLLSETLPCSTVCIETSSETHCAHNHSLYMYMYVEHRAQCNYFQFSLVDS